MIGPAPGPLDILYVGTLPPHQGGSAISGGQILAGLAERGHRVRAVAPFVGDAARVADDFAARHPALNVVRYEVPYFDTSPNVPASDEYREAERVQLQAIVPALLAARRPDVLFAGRESFAWHVPELARRAGLPWVLRLAGGTSHGVLSGAYPAPLAARYLALFRQADVRVTPGRHLAEQMTARGAGPIRVIPTVVDLDDFRPRPKPTGLAGRLGIGPGDVVVAHVSNMKDIKRPEDVVASAPAALARDPRLVYVMVGDGPLRARLEAMSRAAGLAARFRFVGWVDYGDVPAYMNLADLVVLPSRSEGLARAYVETLASGSVLVASDIPPAREVVEDGVTGLLFPVGDVVALAAQTVRAAGDPALRARLGRAGRVRAEAHGTARAVAEYATLLGEVVAGHRAAAARRPP